MLYKYRREQKTACHNFGKTKWQDFTFHASMYFANEVLVLIRKGENPDASSSQTLFFYRIALQKFEVQLDGSQLAQSHLGGEENHTDKHSKPYSKYSTLV